jgi:putative ABC transport system permease protein
VIGWIAALVPEGRRAEWQAEWLGELGFAEGDRRGCGHAEWRVGLMLNARALGALGDALWLRRNDGGPGMGGFEVRGALRVLRRQPAFAAAVVFTLAVGIAAATVIFSMVDGLLLRPVPFSEPERLVEVRAKQGDYTSQFVDAEAAAIWHGQEDVFEDVRAHSKRSVTLMGQGEPQSLMSALVEPGFLPMIGVAPIIGRGFLDEDAVPGRDRVVLLGNELWRSTFAGAPDVIGKTIRLDDEPHTVVGVLPPTVRYLPGSLVHLLLPLPDTAQTVLLIARTPAGTTVARAQARLDGVAAILERERPRDRGWGVQLAPLQNINGGRVGEGLLVLAGAVALLLAIACANAAGLLLLRGAGRQQEFAIRRALGGTRGSLVSQLLAESLGLALLAGALGVILAYWGLKVVLAFIPENVIRFSYTEVQLDVRVLGFALIITILAGLVFGLIPAFRATAVSQSLASAGRGATATRGQRKLRGGLVVAELALAVMLLAGAALLGHSLLRLIAVDPGFEPDGLIVSTLSLPSSRYETSDTRAAFRQRLEETLRAVPGVLGVSQSLGGVPPHSSFMVGPRLETADGHVPASQPETLPFGNVDTAFFSVLGIPILEGRSFRIDDAPSDLGHVVIDRDLARFLWPDQSAVGKRFRRDTDAPWLTVVGVAGSVQLAGPGSHLGEFEIYFPTGQGSGGGYFTVAARVTGDASAAVAALRSAIRALDPDVPIQSLQTAGTYYGEALAMPRFLSGIMIAFAAVALVLAAVGMYGLIAYDVARRTREIGVRVALGARGSRIVGDVFASGMFLVAAGIALGLAGALALGRSVRGLLFGIAPSDPVTLAVAVVVLVGACALALLLPARRAAGVAPMEALRVE